jgi:type II secretory pathway component PulM
MGDTLMVVLTAGVGVVLLVVLVLLALPPVRRFRRANAALRRSVADRIAALRAVAGERRRGPG